MTKKNNTKRPTQLAKTSSGRKKPRGAIPRTISEDPDVLRYYLALTDPFNDKAVGARVPDLYAAHTATYTVHATHTVTVNSGGGGTVFLFPNIVASVYCPQGQSPDFVSTSWGDGTSTTSSRWGLDDAVIAAKLDNYRIVGYGMRLTNLTSMTNATGKFIMGSYPIDSSWHTKDFLVGGATLATNAGYTSAATSVDWGVPLTTGGSFAPNLLVQYPGTKILSAMEMAENCIDVVARPVDPRAFEFRTTNSQFNGWESAGSAAAGAVSTGDASFLDLKGFEALFVSLQGGGNALSSFDIEIIYHIEGRPYLSGISATTAQNTVVAPSSVTPSPVNPNGFFAAVSKAVSEPAVKGVVLEAASLIHPLLGKFAGAVL